MPSIDFRAMAIIRFLNTRYLRPDSHRAMGGSFGKTRSQVAVEVGGGWEENRGAVGVGGTENGHWEVWHGTGDRVGTLKSFGTFIFFPR